MKLSASSQHIVAIHPDRPRNSFFEAYTRERERWPDTLLGMFWFLLLASPFHSSHRAPAAIEQVAAGPPGSKPQAHNAVAPPVDAVTLAGKIRGGAVVTSNDVPKVCVGDSMLVLES